VGDFHIFTMLVILLQFVWWKVAAGPTFGLAWPLYTVWLMRIEKNKISPGVGEELYNAKCPKPENTNYAIQPCQMHSSTSFM